MIKAADVNNHTIRAYHREQLRAWVQSKQHHFRGDVLDFGAGKPGTCFQPEPYRDIVEGAGAKYWPKDKDESIQNSEYRRSEYDTVMCTQVVNYLPEPQLEIELLVDWLKMGGKFLLTYPTNWAFCEDVDLYRFTKAGMVNLLLETDLEIIEHDEIGCIDINGFMMPLGFGFVAVKR